MYHANNEESRDDGGSHQLNNRKESQWCIYAIAADIKAEMHWEVLHLSLTPLPNAHAHTQSIR